MVFVREYNDVVCVRANMMYALNGSMCVKECSGDCVCVCMYEGKCDL